MSRSGRPNIPKIIAIVGILARQGWADDTAAQSAGGGKAARETFQFPIQGDYRLNYCLVSGKRCGEPAAQAWCKGRGFAQAEKWVRDANIGGLFPTIVMGDERICARYLCDGFKEITCSQ